MRKTLLLSQALWAKYTLHLAPEAPGERRGIVSPSSFVPEASARPLRLVAIGDSLVAGSGVENQNLALTPRIARKIADTVNRPVQWETHAKLGSTMRRVRYRFLPEVTGHIDILFICAGSNDVMAKRSKEDWLDDLRAVIEQARTRADHVIVCSAGQPHHSPKLPAMLRRELAIGRPRLPCESVGNMESILSMSHMQSWFQTSGRQMVSTPAPPAMNKHLDWLFRR